MSLASRMTTGCSKIPGELVTNCRNLLRARAVFSECDNADQFAIQFSLQENVVCITPGGGGGGGGGDSYI